MNGERVPPHSRSCSVTKESLPIEAMRFEPVDGRRKDSFPGRSYLPERISGMGEADAEESW
jgi:hypothetical protein